LQKKILILGMLFVILLSGTASAKNVNVKFNFPLNNASNDSTSSVSVPDDSNAFNAFAVAAQQKSISLDVSYYDFDADGIKESAFINSANGLAGSADFSKYWQFSQNNVPSMSGVSASIPNDNETISLDYLEGPIADGFEWLADNQQSNGLFGNNLFQSSFGLMAVSKGEDNNVNLNSSAVNSGISYVLSQQKADASFGDELFTSLATMALLSNGKDLNDFEKNGKNPIDFLAEKQNGDGGFKSGTSESDVDTTAWATIAFAQTGNSMPSKNSKTPIDFLVSAQHSNGSFGYNASDATESVDFTEEAIIAFAAAKKPNDSVVQNSLNWLSSKQGSDGCILDGFRTALGSIAFRSFNETEKADKALDCLKTKSNGDGSFGRTSNLSNALDTSLAVLALSKNTFPLTVSSHGDSNGFAGLNSVVKFLVKIHNTGKVSAKNVAISLNGIPLEWILNSSQGSINFFETILPGETKTAEIFVKMNEVGSYIVSAVVSSDTIKSNQLSSNNATIGIEEAILGISIQTG